MPSLLTTSGWENPAHELLDVILVTGVPYNIRNAARIALKIGLVVESRRTMADLNAVQPLVDDACGLVYILVYTDLGHVYFEDITTLCEVLDGILACVKVHTCRNIFSRAVKAKEIERQVQDLRARLKSLLDRFGFDSNISIQQHFIESMRRHRAAQSTPQENGSPSAAHTSVPVSPVAASPASPASHEPERPRSRLRFVAASSVMPPGYISIVFNVDNGVTRDSGNITTTTALDSYNNNTPRADESRRTEHQVHNPAVVDP
ncbi:hypothetical protein H0H92_006926 [Tricholoma furcatifolium]|nr:hypothetical protein H0H92_006926 [Tricholoma furcatifolium]